MVNTPVESDLNTSANMLLTLYVENPTTSVMALAEPQKSKKSKKSKESKPIEISPAIPAYS